jgi:hypothetical protein
MFAPGPWRSTRTCAAFRARPLHPSLYRLPLLRMVLLKRTRPRRPRRFTLQRSTRGRVSTSALRRASAPSAAAPWPGLHILPLLQMQSIFVFDF